MSTAILELPASPPDIRPPEARERDEVWHGVSHMAPAPNLLHQDFLDDLREFVRFRWAKPTGGRVHREVNLTTPEDEDDWTNNYRIPDLILLDADRLRYERIVRVVGPPLVAVEIRSPGDDSYLKLPFYAGLGVPEVWIIHRDTKVPEIRALTEYGEYDLLVPDTAGWHVSPHTGVQMRETPAGKLRIRVGSDDGTATELPDS